MEKKTKDIFVVGKKEFLTESEAKAYKREIEIIELQNDIMIFLVKENYKRAGSSGDGVFFKEHLLHVNEFLFVSSVIVVKKYEHLVNNTNHRTLGTETESSTFNLCDIKAFKSFYDNMLK